MSYLKNSEKKQESMKSGKSNKDKQIDPATYYQRKVTDLKSEATWWISFSKGLSTAMEDSVSHYLHSRNTVFECMTDKEIQATIMESIYPDSLSKLESYHQHLMKLFTEICHRHMSLTTELFKCGNLQILSECLRLVPDVYTKLVSAFNNYHENICKFNNQMKSAGETFKFSECVLPMNDSEEKMQL